MKWGRHRHRHPCPETDHIDAVLNAMETATLKPTPAEIDQARIWGVGHV